MATDSRALTELLEAWTAGDEGAPERLLPLIYDELRSLARSYFRSERRGHTLQPTALVHEAWVRLVEQPGVRFRGRAHFVGLTAHVMRRVLVDYARDKSTAKRGGKARKVTVAEAAALSARRPPDVLALDQALADLARADPQKAAIVELRFFGGLTIDEIAEHLSVSASTVVREWRRAKAWLHQELVAEPPSAG